MPGGFQAETEAPWLNGLGQALRTLAPLDSQGRLHCLTHWAQARGLQTESGRALRFVSSTGELRDYEAHIFSTGEVPTVAMLPSTWTRLPLDSMSICCKNGTKRPSGAA